MQALIGRGITDARGITISDALELHVAPIIGGAGRLIPIAQEPGTRSAAAVRWGSATVVGWVSRGEGRSQRLTLARIPP